MKLELSGEALKMNNVRVAGLRVLSLTRYAELGASSRYRVLQYLPLLAEQGIGVDVHPLLSNDYIRARYDGARPDVKAISHSYFRRLTDILKARHYDLIWVQGELLPWIPHLFEGLLYNSGVPCAVEYDDSWFHRYDEHSNPLIRRLLGNKIDKLMRQAKHVIAGNEYIADRAQLAGAEVVTVIPTGVDCAAYRSEPRVADAPITIGWIGSPMTSKYLEVVGEPLKRLQKETGCRVTVIGADANALSGLDVTRIEWNQATEAKEVSGLDIGISPLPDGPWERGKCGLKLIQYMAAGKPVVGSPVGTNAKLILDGHNGFLASDDEGWYRALRQLHDNDDLRESFGQINRAKVEQEFDIGALVNSLALTLRQAAATSARRTEGPRFSVLSGGWSGPTSAKSTAAMHVDEKAVAAD